MQIFTLACCTLLYVSTAFFVCSFIPSINNNPTTANVVRVSHGNACFSPIATAFIRAYESWAFDTRELLFAKPPIDFSCYFGRGTRRRCLRLGRHHRSTYLHMTEYFATQAFLCREISLSEINAFYLLCGTPPHPGPMHQVWCAFCTSSEKLEVNEEGFHQSCKNSSKLVYRVPTEHALEKYTFHGVCLWIPNNFGGGWYMKVPPLRQVPDSLIKSLDGAVTFICHAGYQRLSTFQNRKQESRGGCSSLQRDFVPVPTLPETSPATNASNTATRAPVTMLPSQEEFEQMRALLSSTTSKLEHLQTENASLASQLGQLTQVNSELSTELTESKAAYVDACAKLKSVQSELKALQEKQRPAPGLAQQMTMAKFLSTSTKKGSSLAVLPAVTTPAQVFKALKIKKDPVTGNDINPDIWNTTYREPLNKLSQRRLRNLMIGLHYPISQVMRAFHEDVDELLCLYTKSRQTHGQSASTILHVSSLLANPGVQKIISSYNNATTSADRKQVLSVLTSLFTYSDLQSVQELSGPISRRAFSEANHHANAWGAACSAPCVAHVSVRIPTSTLTDVMKHILNPTFIQQVAFGSRDITLSDHSTLKVPKLQRVQLRERMWDLYEAENTDSEGNFSGVSRSVYLQAANIATASDQKSLAALDNNAVRFGRDNFRRMRDLVGHLATWNPLKMTPAIQQLLRSEVDAVETFYKYDFEQHLCLDTLCASHCLTHAFGGLGPKFSNTCPASCGQHSLRCKQCDRLQVLLKNFEAILGPRPTTVRAEILS